MSTESRLNSPLGIMLALSILLTSSCNRATETFWSVSDAGIVKDGKTEYFIGTNLWYAGRLCATPEGRARLETELQTLKGIGVNNLRVLAVEGEDLDNLAYALDKVNGYIDSHLEWNASRENDHSLERSDVFAIEDIPVSYVLVWRNADIRPMGLKHFYAPWPGGTSEKDFVEWVESGKVKML